MTSNSHPSFTRGRRWNLGLNLVVSVVAVLALVLMSNYLGARHFARWSWSSNAQAELSPLSLRVLSGVTNPVKVTLYFDKNEPLGEMSWNLLKAYRYANQLIQIESVDYTREPGAAQLVKTRYKLGDADRDVVIFSCQDRIKVVPQGELSDIDLQPLLTGQSQELKRTHFKGEALFTSAVLNVINTRQPKAYFLEGHGEHSPENDDGLLGYSRFAGVLRENNVQYDRLRLEGPGRIPADCNLLIIAGPSSALQPEVIEKIHRYLQQGGRLFLPLMNFIGAPRDTGLEELLAFWGVAVGRNVVIDEKNYVNPNKTDLVSATFGNHAAIRPVYTHQIYMVQPRSVAKDPRAPSSADAPRIEPLLYTSDAGRIPQGVGKDGTFSPPAANDLVGNVPLMVAVEKGDVRNVSPERGTTRMIVAGDSLFLSNNNIDREANHEFASYAINWLLARPELLVNVPPKPINEYKLTMTATQLSNARWVLIGAFPGSALLLGALVWLRRRR
jgi:hypothetical protein